MKEFKRVTQNDLLLEFLKFVNDNLGGDIDKTEITGYEKQNLSLFLKDISMFVKLNSDEYYVNLLYSDLTNETTFGIYKIIRRRGIRMVEMFYEVK